MKVEGPTNRWPPRKTWGALFSRLRAFQDKTFPEATAASCAAHLAEEVEEVVADPSAGEEWADCLMLVLAGARLAGVDLYAETERKLEINEGRTWRPHGDYWRHDEAS